MKPHLLPILFALALVPFAKAGAKPPPPARPSPTPAPADGGSAPLLRWLLLQNGGPAAASVPWPEIVRTVSGRQISPLDPTSVPDAATLAKLGAALDAALPRLNKPDGALRARPTLTTAEAAARIADDLRATLAAVPGTTVEILTGPAPTDAPCPVLRWNEGPGGRTCYLAVTVCRTGAKDGSVHTLTLRAADLARQITTDGVCLLVNVEYEDKAGSGMTLLNWEAIDLARLSLRCAVGFEADADSLHAPGAVLADGRRGRD